MAGKGRSQILTWQDYLVAYNLLYTEDGQIAFEESDFIKEQLSQEEMVLKQESFTSLSKDAKDVVKIILEAPAEILCDIYNKISKRKIQNLLMHEKKWRKRKVDKIFYEIKTYIQEESI